MLPGFLPFSRSSLMLDIVACAMVVVVPVLMWSVYLVKYRQQYALHKRIQITLSWVLLVTVTAFELDMRFFTDWRSLAKPSPYFQTWVMPSLYIHLLFSISTSVIWLVTVVLAIKHFKGSPKPGAHSLLHKRLGKLSAIDMILTAITGWIFYYLAFVAG